MIFRMIYPISLAFLEEGGLEGKELHKVVYEVFFLKIQKVSSSLILSMIPFTCS